ncbi:MAG: methyltransferase domain-containing protein [Candidatus Thermoplasmatota archaeon]|nr:methyltransferase domain-containing protein [Candidatus Thermoplasmatota archaeon]
MSGKKKLRGWGTTNNRLEYRREHIREMVSLFQPELEAALEDARVLDVGTGLGPIAIGISPLVKQVVAIDREERLLVEARKRADEARVENVDFKCISALEMKFEEDFEIVILSDVLEHVIEQQKLLERCISAMKTGGIMYISTNNRWWPVEGHKFLPLVTYMPRALANRYVRLFKRGRDYEGYYLVGYGKLKKLLSKHPVSYSFKPPENPWTPLYRFGKRLVLFSPFFWRFSPVFQVIVKKTRK